MFTNYIFALLLVNIAYALPAGPVVHADNDTLTSSQDSSQMDKSRLSHEGIIPQNIPLLPSHSTSTTTSFVLLNTGTNATSLLSTTVIVNNKHHPTTFAVSYSSTTLGVAKPKKTGKVKKIRKDQA
jgi:hypothetical protein